MSYYWKTKLITGVLLLAFFTISFTQETEEQDSWVKLTHEIGAFQVELPEEPDYRFIHTPITFEDGSLGNYYLHLYSTRDPETDIGYYVRYNNFPINRTINDVDQILDANFIAFEKYFGIPITAIQSTIVNGYPARSAIFVANGKEIWLDLVLRANRMYLLIMEIPFGLQPIPHKDKFYNSFQFLDWQFMPLSQTVDEPEVAGFEALFPAPIEKDTVLLDAMSYPRTKEIRFSAQDTLSAATYSVIKYESAPYYYIPDTLEYFENIMATLKEDSSLIYLKDTIYAGHKACLGIYQYPPSPTINYNIFFFNGGTLWEVIAYIPNAEVKDKADAFLKSFKLDKWQSNKILNLSKAQQLITDLQSEDSLVLEMAKLGIENYQFQKEELPYIYKALEGDLPPFVKNLLLREFQFNHDEQTVPFLTKEFEKTDDLDRQLIILKALSHIRTEASLSTFFEKIIPFRRDSFDGFIYQELFFPFEDSTALCRSHLDELLQLSSNRALRYRLYYTLFVGAQNDSLLNEMLLPYTDVILQDAERICKTYPFFSDNDAIQEAEEYWHFDAINILLGNLPTQEVVSHYFQNLQSIKDPYLLTTVIDALLKNGQAVEPHLWDVVKVSPHNWYTLLSNLNFSGVDYAIPPDLIDQEILVHAYVDYHIGVNYGGLKEFEILDKRPYEYLGENLVNYLVKIGVGDLEGVFLGVISQPTGMEDLQLYPNIAIYSEDQLNDNNLEILYQKLLIE